MHASCVHAAVDDALQEPQAASDGRRKRRQMDAVHGALAVAAHAAVAAPKAAMAASAAAAAAPAWP